MGYSDSRAKLPLPHTVMSDEPKKLDPYDAWALQWDDGTYNSIGSLLYVECHYSDDDPLPVRVEEVTSEQERTHFGWVSCWRNTLPWEDQSVTWEEEACMIWANKAQFEMCFAAGSRDSAEAGQGRVVWLRITPITPNDT